MGSKYKDGDTVTRLRADGFFQRFIKIGRCWFPVAWKVWRDHNPNMVMPRDSIIHHIDGNSLNDRIENLKLMRRGAHLKLHREG